jgi:hypothetical protein
MTIGQLPTQKRLLLAKLIDDYNKNATNEKITKIHNVIQSLIDRFLQAIEPTKQSIDDFIHFRLFASNDRTEELPCLRLNQAVELSRSRFNERVKYLNIKR